MTYYYIFIKYLINIYCITFQAILRGAGSTFNKYKENLMLKLDLAGVPKVSSQASLEVTGPTPLSPSPLFSLPPSSLFFPLPPPHPPLPIADVAPADVMERAIKEGKVKEDKKHASYTDFLIWAILVNRTELARAIWRKTTLPIHSALIACQLYPSPFPPP
jgi:hypothetical protein